MKTYGYLVFNDRNEKKVVHVQAKNVSESRWGIESARIEAGFAGTITKSYFMGELKA